MKKIIIVFIYFILYKQINAQQVTIPVQCKDGSYSLYTYPSYDACPCQNYVVWWYECDANGSTTSKKWGATSAKKYEELLGNITKAENDEKKYYETFGHHSRSCWVKHSEIICNDLRGDICNNKVNQQPNNTSTNSSDYNQLPTNLNNNSSVKYSTPKASNTTINKNTTTKSNDDTEKYLQDLKTKAENGIVTGDYSDLQNLDIDKIKNMVNQPVSSDEESDNSSVRPGSKNFDAKTYIDKVKKDADQQYIDANKKGKEFAEQISKISSSNSSNNFTAEPDNSESYDEQLREEKKLQQQAKSQIPIVTELDFGDYRNSTSWKIANAGKFMIANNFGQALIEYKTILNSSPNKSEVLNNMGYCSQMLGDYDNAELYYIQALQNKPDYKLAKKNLVEIEIKQGLSLSRQGEYDRALSYYFKAISEENDNVEGYNNIAWTFNRQGNKDKAIEYYKKAASMDSEGAKQWLKLENLKW